MVLLHVAEGCRKLPRESAHTDREASGEAVTAENLKLLALHEPGFTLYMVGACNHVFLGSDMSAYMVVARSMHHAPHGVQGFPLGFLLGCRETGGCFAPRDG